MFFLFFVFLNETLSHIFFPFAARLYSSKLLLSNLPCETEASLFRY